MRRHINAVKTETQQPRRLYVSPAEPPPAVAAGRGPHHAAGCTTAGLMLLDEQEPRGVLGHDLSHVYNRDILTASVAGALTGIVTFPGPVGELRRAGRR